MNCEAVREHVAEHVLGSLPEDVDGEVRAHLRGCMVCRRERAALEEGVSTLARAAHQVEPPEPLKARVLGVLEEERAEAPERRSRVPGKPTSWVAAAVIAALAGTLAWTGVVALRASGEAGRYKDFLAALGGRDVRVGTLAPRSQQQVEGSVVMYDSGRGQSWILVLMHAPGESGGAAVTVQRHQEVRPGPRGRRVGQAPRHRPRQSRVAGYRRVTINRFTARGAAPNRYL
jgi:hypothetical protein